MTCLLTAGRAVDRALFVKNLRFVARDPPPRGGVAARLTGPRRSYNVTPEELFDLFGKFGPIRYAPSVPPLPACVPIAPSAY